MEDPTEKEGYVERFPDDPTVEEFLEKEEYVERFSDDPAIEQYLKEHQGDGNHLVFPRAGNFMHLFENPKNKDGSGNRAIVLERDDVFYVYSPPKPMTFWGRDSEIKVDGKVIQNEIIDLIVYSTSESEALKRYDLIVKKSDDVREKYTRVVNNEIVPELERVLTNDESAYLKGPLANKERIITCFGDAEDAEQAGIDVDIVVLSSRKMSGELKEHLKRKVSKDRVIIDVNIFPKFLAKDMIIEEAAGHKPLKYMVKHSVLLYGEEIRNDPKIKSLLE